MNDLTKLRIFLSKRQSIEVDLARLEESGNPVGRSINIEQEDIVDLRNFDSQVVRQAQKMSACYKLLYCFENDLRERVRDTLQEKYGKDWWNTKVNEEVRKEVEDRKKRERDSVMLMRSENDNLIYTTLGELKIIITDNWEDFQVSFRSRRFVEKILTEINQFRIVVAHSAELDEIDIDQLESKIKYWLSQDPTISIL